MVCQITCFLWNGSPLKGGQGGVILEYWIIGLMEHPPNGQPRTRIALPIFHVLCVKKS